MAYALYVRKSSESEDRQVASIDSQIFEMTQKAQSQGITFKRVFVEEMSAKAPGRPVFNEMMEAVQRGEFDGLGGWRLNRLARNPIDGGSIIWALQTGQIKHIITSDRDYRPEDNVLPMYSEFAMAHQYVNDLRKDTARGVDKKLRLGWLPTHAPVGYLNDPYNRQGEKTIRKDEEQFPLVRQLWDKLLTGSMSVSLLVREASAMKIVSRRSGKPLAKSAVYALFTNPFYAGKFRFRGELYDGAHEPMITEDEFDLAQRILGKRGKPRLKSHQFAYTGMIRCVQCGSMITAEEKIKIQKNGNIHRYVYYRCTKSGHQRCSQRAISETSLEQQICRFLDDHTVSEEFSTWALGRMKKRHTSDTSERVELQNTTQRAIRDVQGRLDDLIDLALDKLITNEEFERKKAQLIDRRTHLEKQEQRLTTLGDDWIELAQRSFEFCKHARFWFEHGEWTERKFILESIGSNLVLDGPILRIEPEKVLAKLHQPSKNLEWGLMVDEVRTVLIEECMQYGTARLLRSVETLRAKTGKL